MVSLVELVILITLTPTFITEPAPITLTRELMLCWALPPKVTVPPAPVVVEEAALAGHQASEHRCPPRRAEFYAFKERIAEIDQFDLLLLYFFNSFWLWRNCIYIKRQTSNIFIINSDKDPNYFIEKFHLSGVKLVVADISKLALEKNLTIDGIPVINTPILGLLSKALPDLSLENLKKVITRRMEERLAKQNIELISEGYKLAKIL